MIRKARFILTLAAAFVIQATLFPAYLADPFKPNLTLFFIVHLGLREQFRWINFLGAFGIGLVQDCFSGITFGLQGFTYLLIYIIFKQTSDRLYTDNSLLIVMGVFIAVILNGLFSLTLLMLFSAAEGIYSSLFSGLLPHALASTLAAVVMIKMVPVWTSGHAR